MMRADLRFERALNVGVAAILGLVLSLSLMTHFLLEVINSTREAYIVLGLTAVLSIAVYWTTTNLIHPLMRAFSSRMQWVLIILPLTLAAMFVRFYWSGVQQTDITAVNDVVGMAESLPRPFKSWNKRYWGFEVHATIQDSPQWEWRTFAKLPATFKLIGGKLSVLLTQPDWAVFDPQGKVYEGGDGVEVRFSIEDKGARETLEKVSLNLHSYPEQRRWQKVEITVPPGTRHLIVEAWPGLPGSNNWFDRVWLSFETTESHAEILLKLADWLTLTAFIFLTTSTLFLMARVSTPTRAKRALVILAANILPLIFFFFLCETYLRMLKYQPYEETFPGQYRNSVPGTTWVKDDRLLGWRIVRVEGETNEDGFRDKKNFNSSARNSGKTRVMILGDSFLYGANVNPDENVPSLLEAKLGDRYEFYNLAVPGWGVDQMYLAYEQYKEIIKPHIVILGFIDEDIGRVLEAYRLPEGMNKPSFAIKDDRLVPRSPPTSYQRFLNRSMATSVFWSLGLYQVHVIRNARRVVNHIFLRMAEETKRQGTRFVVVRIPTAVNADLINNFVPWINNFGGLLALAEVPYLDPLNDFKQTPQWTKKFYIPQDGHLSVAGNQFLADYLRRHVFGKGIQGMRTDEDPG